MRKGVHAQVVVDDDVYSKKKKWKIFLWIAAGVVVIFGGLFGGMYYYFSHMQDNDTSSDDNRGGDVAVEQDVDQAVDYATQDVIVEQHGTSHDDAVQQHDAVAEKVPVILYFEQISEETKRHRAWPTVRIFRKVGSGNPEMLADVGKIGEYPSGFLMSPDHRFLLINLESKLQMLDIATKKLTDIFIPKKEVRNVIFSPDGAQLMIWDQKNVPEEDDQRSYVHIFDLATKTGHVIRKSHDTSMFHLLSWRSDGKVIVAELMGETSGLWSMDVKSGHMKKTPVNASAGPMSDNGMMMAIVKNTITDICNHLSGTSPSAYNVVDPVSGDVRGVIDGKGESIFVLAFSPDGSEVLYRAAKPWDKEDRCGHAQKWRYYKKHLTSGDTVALTDKSETLRLWDRDYVGAEAVYGNGETLNKIVVDGETIAMAQSWCEVIGEYYSAQ